MSVWVDRVCTPEDYEKAREAMRAWGRRVAEKTQRRIVEIAMAQKGMVDMAGGENFNDEWALRVGRRIRAGEGVDTEADKPVDMGYHIDPGKAWPWIVEHKMSPPGPVVEAVADEEDVEISVTPAHYEEMIALRATKACEAELAMLRERRRALEADIEETYDKLEHERDQRKRFEYAVKRFEHAVELERERCKGWMGECGREKAAREQAENQIDAYAAAKDRYARIATICASMSVGTAAAALWGQQILAWIYS